MFSGIVEAQAGLLSFTPKGSITNIELVRPEDWDDLKPGDSVAVDGVCLTIENLSEKSVSFALGLETLNVTKWSSSLHPGRVFNLERSLPVGARLHGHWVTGHVDGLGLVEEVETNSDYVILVIAHPSEMRPYIWRKGSVAVNGVSLTVNTANGRTFSVGLIPETLKRTNLTTLKSGDFVNLEIDQVARGLVHYMKIHTNLKGQSFELHP